MNEIGIQTSVRCKKSATLKGKQQVKKNNCSERRTTVTEVCAIGTYILPLFKCDFSIKYQFTISCTHYSSSS